MSGRMVVNAGRWKIHLSSPHPVWCVIEHEGDTISSIHHADLRDLEYAVKRAIIEAGRLLPESHRSEMD